MTLLEKLQQAGLPVISADESGEISMGILTNEQDVLFKEILLEHFQPEVYSEYLIDKNNRAVLKTEYVATLATLEQIETTVSPTNAQVVAAVKFLAKTLGLLLKLIVRTL